MRNYVYITDQPWRFNDTCVDMLSVGVSESKSVHTLMISAAGREYLHHPETWKLKKMCELQMNKNLYLQNYFFLAG